MYRLILFFGFVAGLLLPANFLEGKEFSQSVSELLQHGWSRNAQDLLSAEAAYRDAIQQSPRDAKADYAWALVQMRNGKFDAAKEALARAVGKDPTDLRTWRANVWLMLYRRSHLEALDEIQRLADLFPQSPSQQEQQLVAACRLMGRFYGYLAGPGEAAVEASLLAQRETKLLRAMTGNRRAAFEMGKGEVAEHYRKLQEEIDAARREDNSGAEQKVEAQREFVEKEKVRIAEEMELLEKTVSDAKNVMDREVSEIDQDLIPIQRRYAEVEAYARPHQQRIREYELRLSQALSQASAPIREGGREGDQNREEDRRRRERAQREADRWRFEIRREEEALRPLILQAQQLQAQAAGLQRRRAAAVGTYQSIYARSNTAARKLQRTSKTIAAAEREWEFSAKPSDSGRVRSMRAKLPVFVTYERFPLEQERERLLSELRN